MSTITKLSQDVTQYYKNITSPIRVIARIQRDIQICTVQKSAHELQKKNSRDEQGALKDRALDGLSMIHASAVYLWLATGRIYKLQAPGSGHADLGKSETPQRVVRWMPSGVQK